MPRTLQPFVYGGLTLLIAFPFSKALSINALPATVSVGQIETLTWFRTRGDPPRFQFAKTISGKDALGLIGDAVTMNGDVVTQGTIPITFLDAGPPVTIVAYNPNPELANPTKKKPNPIFSDPRTIAIVSAGPPGPPINNPTSTTLPLTPPQTTVQGITTTPPGQNGRSTITTNPAPPTGTATSVSNLSSGVTATVSVGSTGSQPESNGSNGVLVNPTTQVHGISRDTIPPENGKDEKTISSGSTPASATPPSGSSGGPNHRPTNLDVIVGVILGVLAFVILILLAICLHRRNHRSRFVPGRIEAFYREKMVKSEEHVPPPTQPDLEPLNRRLSVISEVTTTNDSDTNTLNAPRHPSSDLATLQVPENHAIYTITESESIVDSLSTLESSDFASTIEPSEDYYGVAPRTDRQMDIEKKIFQLQEELVHSLDRTRSGSTDSVPSTPQAIGEIRDRIKKLRELQEGEWAREVSDEPPSEISNY